MQKMAGVFYKGLTIEKAISIIKGKLLSSNLKLEKDSQDIIFGLMLTPSNFLKEVTSFNFCGVRESLLCAPNCVTFLPIDQKYASMNHLARSLENMIAKSYLYLEHKDIFYSMLQDEINSTNRVYKNALFRLNTNADLNWYDFISVNEETRFYDYTKILSRENLENYRLTYSYAPNLEWYLFEEKLNKGNNVAMVFDIKKSQPLPLEYKGYKVKSGDINDNRWQDKAPIGEKGYIIGLKKKVARGGGKTLLAVN